ncbi:MAG: hypothetical protein LBS92_03695 [Candidatus Methanoplasma sp.]|jgi:hypothetical protein|nr:hypothetical protein [Candidatus Methanoplasma sp.]
MNDDPGHGRAIGMYDFKTGEIVPLSKCVERGLLTKEEAEADMKRNIDLGFTPDGDWT